LLEHPFAAPSERAAPFIFGGVCSLGACARPLDDRRLIVARAPCPRFYLSPLHRNWQAGSWRDDGIDWQEPQGAS